MKQLISGTTAYGIFSRDAASGRLSHAYMLHLNDAGNLRYVLKRFALSFFGLNENDVDGRRIMNETLVDCHIYPGEGKKINTEAVNELLAESALQPLEYDKKLFVISGFNEATALIQNKLLKTLEEPPRGVYFLLGVTTTAPVLDTVKSRVKTLTIPPFTESQIYSALCRRGDNSLNREAAKSCGGIFGAAENMVDGSWFGEIVSAAGEISSATDLDKAGAAALKYGEIKRKNELLTELGLIYHTALCEKTQGLNSGKVARLWSTSALIYAVERVDRAAVELKFNAFFQGLLYDLMLGIIEENNKWLKLQA